MRTVRYSGFGILISGLLLYGSSEMNMTVTHIGWLISSSNLLIGFAVGLVDTGTINTQSAAEVKS